MQVQDLLKELRTSIETARAMPMSSSAVINRTAVLDLIGQLEAALPAASSASDEVSRGRSVVPGVSERADEMLENARAERARLVSASEVHRAAEQEARTLLRGAEQEAAELRTDIDEYVDSRLANLEISLTKTLDAVARGRERLHSRSHFDSLGESTDDDPVDGLTVGNRPRLGSDDASG